MAGRPRLPTLDRRRQQRRLAHWRPVGRPPMHWVLAGRGPERCCGGARSYGVAARVCSTRTFSRTRPARGDAWEGYWRNAPAIVLSGVAAARQSAADCDCCEWRRADARWVAPGASWTSYAIMTEASPTCCCSWAFPSAFGASADWLPRPAGDAGTPRPSAAVPRSERERPVHPGPGRAGGRRHRVLRLVARRSAAMNRRSSSGTNGPGSRWRLPVRAVAAALAESETRLPVLLQ